MPAKDKIHDAIKNALIKQEWKITADPYTLRYGDEEVHIDLAAERLLAAEKDGEKIAVEIKSFVGRSRVHDLEVAVGQYGVYAGILAEMEPDRKFYLAVGEAVYDKLVEMKMFTLIVKRYQIALIVASLVEEKIIQWIP